MSPKLVERLRFLLRFYTLPLAIGLLGIIFIIIGVFSMLVSTKNEESIVFDSKEEDREDLITVDVSGAVVNTGVYTLPSGSRIQDALIAAGGLASEADREWAAKNLNLAAKLLDGGKIYVPEKGTTPLRQGSAGQAGTTGTDLTNINTASLSQLDKLPGIGPVTAQKIIDNRPYSEIDELLTKKVVGKKVFQQIKEQISVY